MTLPIDKFFDRKGLLQIREVMLLEFAQRTWMAGIQQHWEVVRDRVGCQFEPRNLRHPDVDDGKAENAGMDLFQRLLPCFNAGDIRGQFNGEQIDQQIAD